MINVQGVPLRLEVGPREKVAGEYVLVGRVDSSRLTVSSADLEVKVREMLDKIHQQLFAK